MKRFFLLFLAILSSLTTVSAQQFYVSSPNASQFPIVESAFYAFDSYGRLLHSLSAYDITVSEDNLARPITLLKCPPSSPVPLSAVLMLDVSSSMNEPQGNSRLDMVKSAASAFIESLADGINECAVGSFDDVSYINQDFTTDATALLSAVARLRPLVGTNYDEALLTPPAGALAIAKTSKYKKVIIFLTDGLGTGNEQAIIARAASLNTTIYCITAGLPMPLVLRNIAEKTGGSWFENINSKAEAITIFRTIFQLASEIQPCIVRWQSGVGCTDSIRHCKISIPSQSLSADVSYFPPSGSTAKLDISPSTLTFGEIPPGTSKTLSLTLKAIGAPIKVRNISSSYPSFNIQTQQTLPFILTAGSSTSIYAQFSPIDSFYRTAVLMVETDLCPAEAYLSGGFDGKFPSPPDLKILRPNGGEIFVVGTKETIQWKGTSLSDTIKLEYSFDGGNLWNTIAYASGLQYKWLVPNTPSKDCIARITHSAANSVNDAIKVRTLAGHANTIQDVCFAPDGSASAATASSDGTVILWNTNDGIEKASLKGHSNIVYSVAFSKDATKIITGSADSTVRIWDSYTGAQTQMLLGHKSSVLTAAFSPFGQEALTGCEDGSLRIWNIPFESTTRILSGHKQRIYDAEFSPDGKLAISAGGDRAVRLWNTTNGAEISPAFMLHGNSVRACSFSPDGNKIASGSSDNSIYIWNVSSRKPDFLLQGHSAVVRSVTWSPDGKRLLSGGEDGRVIIWDAIIGKQILALPSYSEAVASVAWNAHGDSIIVAHGNIADIWALRTIVSQQDTSDARWTIAKPTVHGRNVDFGRVVVGSAKDSIVQTLFVNSGSYPAVVTGFAIQGANPNDFSIISGGSPFLLDAGKTCAVELLFRPSDIGNRSALLQFFTSYGDTLNCSIWGVGAKQVIALETPFVDFGIVEVGLSKDTIIPVIVRNTSDKAIEIMPSQQLGPDAKHFSIINPQPYILQPNGVHPLTLRFRPDENGRASGRFALEFQEIGSPLYVRLFGQGLGGIVSLPNDSAFAGEKREFSIILSGAKPSETQSSTIPVRFTAEIEYDASILFCNNSSYNPRKIEKNGEIKEHIYIDKSWDGFSSELAKIPVFATLGTAETTPLTISSFAWLSAKGDTLPIASETRNGTFKLRGICGTKDGKRFFRSEGKTELKTVIANNSTISIDFSAGETGDYTIEFYDILGRAILIDRFPVAAIGEINRIISLPMTCKSVCFVVLRSPTVSLVQPFLYK